MLEKYFKFWVNILNNLENEHQGPPIRIFEALEKCENAGLRSQFDCICCHSCLWLVILELQVNGMMNYLYALFVDAGGED